MEDVRFWIIECARRSHFRDDALLAGGISDLVARQDLDDYAAIQVNESAASALRDRRDPPQSAEARQERVGPAACPNEPRETA